MIVTITCVMFPLQHSRDSMTKIDNVISVGQFVVALIIVLEVGCGLQILRNDPLGHFLDQKFVDFLTEKFEIVINPKETFCNAPVVMTVVHQFPIFNRIMLIFDGIFSKVF